MKTRFCFVTEADLDRKGVGGVITDRQMLHSLREFADVDVIYLQRIRFRSTPLALTVFFFQILRSFSRPYKVYFTRGLITALFLVVFNTLTLNNRRIVHRGLSVPLASKEARFLKFGRIESLIRYSVFVFLERLAFPRVDVVTVAADVYRRELIEAGVQPEKVSILNFITSDDFFDQPIKSNSEESFHYCYVGGFHFYQDLQPMLEGFETFSRTHTDAKLVLVGEGLQRAQLEEEVAERKMRNSVTFVGKIPHSSLPAFLSKIDCFISLTRKPGLSISIVEAAAAGKPIIAFATRNDLCYNGYFVHRKEIYLVNSISSDEIADAMTQLYEDQNLRSTLAHGARRVAEQYFSQKVAHRQLAELLLRINQNQPFQ